MALRFYIDHNVSAAVVEGLRLRGVDLITAFQDDRHESEDDEVLERATVLSRVVVTQDDDFLQLASAWISIARPLSGVVYAHQMRITMGQMIDDLCLLAVAGETSEVENNIVFLPLG